MLTEYVDEALRRARYELVDDKEAPTTDLGSAEVTEIDTRAA